MKYCTKCGNEIKDGNKFCTKCGAAVGEAEKPVEQAEAKEQTAAVNEQEKKVEEAPEQAAESTQASANGIPAMAIPVKTYNPPPTVPVTSVQEKNKTTKILIISITSAVVVLTFIISIFAYFITISNRTVFISKKQMIDQVTGSYHDVTNYTNIYLNSLQYNYIIIREDEVLFSKSYYWGSIDEELNYDYTYEIKSFKPLTGKIKLDHGHYLIIAKDRTIIDDDGNVYS